MPSRRDFLAALAAPSMLRRGRDGNGGLDLGLAELAANPAPFVDAPPSWPEDSNPAFWDPDSRPVLLPAPTSLLQHWNDRSQQRNRDRARPAKTHV
jgi:hypothetical protein